MSKQQRIIVSIVGITIVLLALLGITYAYYLTRIQGNTNTNSISITTADLKLVYGDGNGEIIATGVMPGDSITKTFTVENTGENKVNGYTIVIENVVNELSRREDLTYDLICTLVDGTSCGESKDNLYPESNNIAIIYANDIDKDVKHNYTLIVKYIYLDTVDQSDDMGSSISGKVNIYDAKDEALNPYKTGVTATDNKILAYNIIENASLEKNGTSLTGTPLTKVAEEISLESEAVLSTAPDDYGISYYFRGSVENNYVNFGGMCWRIVRIQGDGSVKLILEDKNTFCNADDYTGNWEVGKVNFGYDKLTNDSGDAIYIINFLTPQTAAQNSLVKALYDFQINKLNDYIEQLKSGDWCYSDKTYTYTYVTDGKAFSEIELTTNDYFSYSHVRYNASTRLDGSSVYGYQPTFKCDGERIEKFKTLKSGENTIINELSMYIGVLTADEIAFAGGKIDKANTSFYLLNEYQKNNDLYFWSLSPSFYQNSVSRVYILKNSILNGSDFVTDYQKHAVRPSINLKSGTTISSGNGTIDNPYVVE